MMGTVRRQLVEMREDKGLSRERLAYEIGVNVRTVCRWEAGERTPQMAQRVSLAEALGRPLADVLRALRDHDDGDGPPLTGHAVAGHLTHYESLEQAATVIHAFETLAVPGLLQTAAYATFVARASIAHPTAAEVARRVEFRLRRQQVLRREPEPLRLHALLDGSVLLRETGGPVVMAAQLEHLRVMNEMPNVEIRVVPLDGRVFAAYGSFQILSGQARRPYTAITESISGIQYAENPPSLVDEYVALFDALWEAADELENVELLNGRRHVRGHRHP